MAIGRQWVTSEEQFHWGAEYRNQTAVKWGVKSSWGNGAKEHWQHFQEFACEGEDAS